MTKKISTYGDLLRQEEQLEELLKAQKELLVYDLREIKEQLKPASAALSFISKITTRDKSNFLLNAGGNKLIDLVVKKLILGKAGWLTRLAVPFFLKNYSSHFIADHKDDWTEKLFSWFGQKNGKGKAAPQEYGAEAGGDDQ
ncbi:MAG: hypothetical protein HOP10_08380 [Chitinophagaceae bacterium]|nr:hypothetical protein [Chitinophagaceae bacterium]